MASLCEGLYSLDCFLHVSVRLPVCAERRPAVICLVLSWPEQVPVDNSESSARLTTAANVHIHTIIAIITLHYTTLQSPLSIR